MLGKWSCEVVDKGTEREAMRHNCNWFWGMLSVVLLCSFSGCSYLNIDEPNLDISDYRLTTTGVGAATGAVVGGVLGAVVTSGSGDIGMGLVIGSVAGAAAGGAVGRAMEVDEEKTNEEQQQALRRQKSTMAKTRDNTQEAKRQPLDHPKVIKTTASESLAKPKPRSSELGKEVGSDEVVRSERRVHLDQAEPRTPVQAEKPKVTREVLEPPPSPTPAPAVAKVTAPPKVEPAKAIKGSSFTEANVDLDQSAAESSSGVVSDLPPAKKTGGEQQKSVEKQEKSAVLPPATVEKSAAVQEASPAKRTTPPAECERAEEEANRARTSTSEADRLFYLRRALRLCPKDANLHVELSRVFESIGRKDDAIYELKQAQQLDPQHPDVRQRLDVLEGEVSKSGGNSQKQSDPDDETAVE